MSHSPTPWTLEIDERYGNHQLRDAEGFPLACFDEDEGAEARADGMLCAAAPDMLQALETTAGNIRSLGPAGVLPEPYTEWLKAVDAAIAKAHGEPS